MIHRRRKIDSNVQAPSKAPLAPIKAETVFGCTALRLRGGELYTAWNGPCTHCGKLVEKEDLAKNGIRCPHCSAWLYTKGNRKGVADTVKEKEDGDETVLYCPKCLSQACHLPES